MDINSQDLNLERIWKHFGKNTTSGKLLYELYGVNFRPENHIKYPKIIKTIKKTNETKEIIPKSSRIERTKQVLSQINYPLKEENNKRQFSKVDLIPKRKNYLQIEKDIKIMKDRSNVYKPKELVKDRKKQILDLQDKFQFKEKVYLPEKARPPKIDLSEEEIINQINSINKEKLSKVSKVNIFSGSNDEISKLHNAILIEIEERYKEIDYYDRIKDNKKRIVLMNEIKERVAELKKLEELKEKQ